MRIVILTLVSFTIFSCSAVKKTSLTKVYGGEYFKEYKDGTNYSLILKYDSSFSYVIKGGAIAHSGSRCDGKWELSSDTLFLKCSEEKFPAQISVGYMNDREKAVIILSKSKLKIDGIVLKKKS